jgi:hypothetical protein
LLAIDKAGKMCPPVPPPLIMTLSFLYSILLFVYVFDYIQGCLYVVHFFFI